MGSYQHLDFKHLNSDLLCSVAILTTGSDPEQHDMLSLAIIPLDVHLKPSKEYRFLYARLKPRFGTGTPPRGLHEGIQHYQLFGQDWWDAAKRFDQWIERLELKHNKRIQPLGHQYQTVRPWLIEWLGRATYEQSFSEQVRDITTAALAKNDACAWRAEPCPFPKHHLSYYRSQLNQPAIPLVDSLEYAKAYPEVYGEILKSIR